MFRYGTTNADAIKLKLFPLSLVDDAKVWFNELSPSAFMLRPMNENLRHEREFRLHQIIGGKVLRNGFRESTKSTMEQNLYCRVLNKNAPRLFKNKLPPKLHQPDVIFTIRFTLRKHLETYKDEYPLSQSYLPIPNGDCEEHARPSREIQLNHGVGDDRITFLIDKAMRHSHSNDDTCFRVDVIDEITDEEMDALLDDSKPFSTTSEKISESSLDHEFEEFMAIEIKEIPKQEEEVENNFKVLPFEGNQRIKISIQELLTDLVMKLLPEHLRYVFLEKDSLIPVVISALLQDDEKKRLVSVLKKHKEAFAWKTSNILSISPSFCKHKINFKDDAKPIIQRQRRLNPSMKKVVKKRLSNFSLPISMDFPVYNKFRGQAVCEHPIKKIPHSLILMELMPISFDIEIKNEKGAENVAADHLSRLKNLHLEELRDDDIDDNFPDETLMNISSTKEDKIPWFAHFANFLVGKILRKGLTYAQRWKFFLEIKHYFWDEPYLFKMCPDGMIRRCVYGAETRKILDECHHGPTRGCYAPSTAAKKVFDCWAVGKQSSKRLIL
ncbi:hypothetical protein Tco_0134778 [Tanacetum coccineum]